MVLLTGATGFLGSALLPRLAARGEVLALYRPGSNPLPVDGVKWVALDLAAPFSTQLPESVDTVIHIAQSRRYREFPDGAVDVHEVSAAATVRLLDYCRRAGGARFIYASSGAVYAPGPNPVREADTPQPGNFYAASKLAGELAVEQFREALCGHVLRMFFIYGPGQRDMFIPGLIGRVRLGQNVMLAGPDGIRVNPIYVDEAADAVVAVLDLDQPVTLNIAGLDIVSVRQIAELAGRLVGTPPTFVVGDPRPDLVAATERLDALIKVAHVGFEDGLRRTVEAG